MLKHALLAASAIGLSAVLLAANGADAKTLRFSFQGDVSTLDPHGLNETFTLGFQSNVYEGLISRGKNLEILPSLATSWSIEEPTRWRFNLRQGVKFHNGNDFNADDVVFSAERVVKEGSDLAVRMASVKDVVKIDDYTVDFITEVPNPILHFEWDTWFIMDKEWSEANGAADPTNVAGSGTNFANVNMNGTGPFKLVSREPDVRTELTLNADWWDAANLEANVTDVVFQPIASDATRIAALLSGEMDLVFPVPIQDIDRVDNNDGTTALTGPELRTIFLGFDQERDELLYSDVTGVNPFKDKRVREAFYRAIDADAIKRSIMRGQSTPSAAMVAPGINGFPPEIERLAYDPDMAKSLLTEAGYPEGFEVTMDCPNDRYVNDEAICQAVVAMMARVGIDVNLLAQTKSKYFAKVLKQGGYDTSFYLLGWTPGSFDSWNPLQNLIHTRTDAGAGTFNLGGYSNETIDGITAQVLVETDADKRTGLIHDAWQVLHDDVGYVPLHQQALSWGVRDGVTVAQRADNVFLWQWVVIAD